MIKQQFVQREIDLSKNQQARVIGPCWGFRIVPAYPASGSVTATNLPGGIAPPLVEVIDVRSGQTTVLELSDSGWVTLKRQARLRVVTPGSLVSAVSDNWIVQYATEEGERIDNGEIRAMVQGNVSGSQRGSPLAMDYGNSWFMAKATMRGGNLGLVVATPGYLADSGAVAGGALVSLDFVAGGASAALDGINDISVIADNTAGAGARALSLLTYAFDGVTLLDSTLLRNVAAGQKERVNVGPWVSTAGPANVYGYSTVLPPRFKVQLAANGAAAARLILMAR